MDRSLIHDEHTAQLNQTWLGQAARRLFPAPCAIAVQRYDRADIPLPPADEVALSRAVEKRQREFSAGRAAAGAALTQLGCVSQRIPVGPDRNPLWPAGLTGSIAHTAGLAVAAVAQTDHIAALGIDLELKHAVRPDLWKSILGEQEINWVSAQPQDQQIPLTTVIFGAKESFYKLQFPLTHHWVDFNEAQVDLSPDRGEFRLTCTSAPVTALLQQSVFSGRFAIGPDFVLTGMCLFCSDKRSLPDQICPPDRTDRTR